MTQSSYPEQDYLFGQIILTLRSSIGLTQASLAAILGVSRRSVADWEAGKKYPTSEHLKAFIRLAIEQQAFHAGREAEEIRALWRAARSKLLLDETWLATLLTTPVHEDARSLSAHPPAREPRMNWGNAPAISNFYGREWELSLLSTWVIEERCRVVSLLGLGGIGKSTLSVSLMHHLAADFEAVLWRSVRDAPSCEALLNDILQVLVPAALGETAPSFDQLLNVLLAYLRDHRALLVLDNLETLLDEQERMGQVRAGYEGYARLLRRIGESEHQSCLLLTSREKSSELVRLEGTQSPVRSLRLARLDADSCEHLLAEKGVVGTSSEQARLIEAYAGNPLALKIVAQTITALFDGEIAPFLEQGEVIYGGVRDLLSEQFSRLSTLEQSVMLWLAILREASSLDDLLSMLVVPVPRGRLLEAVDSLHRRSLIERGQASGSFTLQSVVLEYVTSRLISEVISEIEQGRLSRLVEHGLALAQLREYVRQTQERLIVAPIVAQLCGKQQDAIAEHLIALLRQMTTWPDQTHGYAPSNVVTLLRLIRGNLRGVDMSGLALRRAYFRGIEMEDASLAGAFVQMCEFTEAFDGVLAVVVSPDGRYWASTSETGEVRVWEAGGHTLHRVWPSSTDIIYRIVFSPDGRRLVGGKWDGSIKLWDIDTGDMLWTAGWPESVSQISSMTFSPDGSIVCVSGNDTNVRLLDATSGEQIHILTHPQRVMGMAWNADSTLLVTGDIQGTIRLWTADVSNRAEAVVCIATVTGDGKSIYGLAFSPDDKVLAGTCADGTLKLWDAASVTLLQTIQAHVGWALRVRWSPDGRTIASSGRDQVIMLWDVERGSFRAALRGHKSMIGSLTFTPDGRQLVSGSPDGTMRVWDVETGECIRVMEGYTACIIDLDWSPDGQQVVSGGTDFLGTVHTLKGDVPPRLLRGHRGHLYAVGWSPDGRWIASSERENVVRVWDAQTGECVQMLNHPDDKDNFIYSLRWSPDSRRVAVGTARYGLVIWDMETRRSRWAEYPFPASIAGRVVWSPDGTQIAGGGNDRQVYLWDADGNVVKKLAGHQSKIASVGWSPDGRQLVSASASEVLVWDVEREELIATMVERSRAIITVTWGASDKVVISGSSDGKLRWWDIQTGECLFVREAHQGMAQSIRTSADGTKLASCGTDGAITIWDVRTGEYLQTVRRDRPYERLDITGIEGLTEAQKATLQALGALEQ